MYMIKIHTYIDTIFLLIALKRKLIPDGACVVVDEVKKSQTPLFIL